MTKTVCPDCPECKSKNTECMGTFEIFGDCWNTYYCIDCKHPFRENFKKESKKRKSGKNNSK